MFPPAVPDFICFTDQFSIFIINGIQTYVFPPCLLYFQRFYKRVFDFSYSFVPFVYQIHIRIVVWIFWPCFRLFCIAICTLVYILVVHQTDVCFCVQTLSLSHTSAAAFKIIFLNCTHINSRVFLWLSPTVFGILMCNYEYH